MGTDLLNELYRIHLRDSRVNIYLYGIVIVVGGVDSVDKSDSDPPVGDAHPKHTKPWTGFQPRAFPAC